MALPRQAGLIADIINSEPARRISQTVSPRQLAINEVMTVYQGKFQLHTDYETDHISELDSIWLPGCTELVYDSKYSLLQYAIHSANRTSDS